MSRTPFAVPRTPDEVPEPRSQFPKDPTSHNFFPFELGIFLSPTIVYMIVVLVLHRRVAPRGAVRALKCRECGAETPPGPAACSNCGAQLKGAEGLN